MKIILLISAILLLFITSGLSQDYPKARYLNVENDKNIRKNMEHKLCLSCSDNNFIVDGNESYGYIELEFSGINAFGRPKAIELIVNTSDVEWAESGDGFAVYFMDDKIGSIAKVSRNTCNVVSLNVSKLVDAKNIKLVLKANGSDGLYILSKKSGFGPVLKLQY